jgi:hypothetical protein
MSYTVDDFVMTYDNFFSSEECRRTIDCFNRFEKNGFTVNRQTQGNKKHEKSDDQLYWSSILSRTEMDVSDMEPCNQFNTKFWDIIYPIYSDKFSILTTLSHHTIRLLKLQKTEIGGGYHQWHCEDDSPTNMRRMMTFILYLNDVDEGGESEFLYYSRRVKSKEGRLILWPAGYTHTHRGNPPISNTKYIMTGWVEMS